MSKEEPIVECLPLNGIVMKDYVVYDYLYCRKDNFDQT